MRLCGCDAACAQCNAAGCWLLLLLAADSVLHCCTAAVGPTTESMVELNAPHLNFAAMAEGHGCKSTGKKTRLCCASLETKTPNIKPRQARDKHRKS